jgi:glucose-1-phosphatase
MEFSKEPVKALLFDLGGVVIDIDFNRVFEAWSAYAGVEPQRLKSKFTFDTFYEHHERNEITGAAYFASLRESLEINLTDEQCTKGWNAINRGEVSGIQPLLRQARQYFPLYAFSNTNPTHWTYLSSTCAELLNEFERIFLSFEMGQRKPDRAAFEMVSSSIGVNAAQILFFDDLLENVEGARKAGLQAVHVQSVADTQKALESLLAIR